MRNQFFSLGRFLKYFRFQLNLLGRGYALAYTAALVISVIVSVILVAVELSDEYPRPFPRDFQAVVLFGLGVVSVLLGTWMYARLNKKEAMIGFLSVPASHFEKTIVSFILSFITPAIVCLLFYFICEQAMFLYFRSHALPFLPNEYQKFGSEDELRYYGESLWQQVREMYDTKMFLAFFVSAYVAIHSFFVLGSLIFRRFSFVLTSISLGLLIFLSASLVVLLSFGILGSERIEYIDRYAMYLAEEWFKIKGYRGDEQLLIFSSAGAFMLAATVIWCAAYLKLKEKEVR